MDHCWRAFSSTVEPNARCATESLTGQPRGTQDQQSLLEGASQGAAHTYHRLCNPASEDVPADLPGDCVRPAHGLRAMGMVGQP